MGDDTWTTVFPTSFEPNMSYPYDSFNVEDLHTVDEGVVEHLFPLLRNDTIPWDFLIGHFLGVDHVGHRLGPDHPVMKAKLEQMDNVLRSVVDLLDDDTLLVLMGDHGMDRKGDHGGDTELEVTAAVWFYSKGRPVFNPVASISPSLLPMSTFPGALIPHRSIQQIDLVPSLALMLGLPIPFNNLGSIVPELFWDDIAGQRFDQALRLNVEQLKRYLQTYRAGPHGSELDASWSILETLYAQTTAEGLEPTVEKDGSWASLKDLWGTVSEDKESVKTWSAMNNYLRTTLAICRHLWAQFNITLITMGLVLLVSGTVAIAALWLKLGQLKDDWEAQTDGFLREGMYGLAVGIILGTASLLLWSSAKGVEPWQTVLFAGSVTSCLAVIISARPKLSLSHLKSFPIVLVLHAAAFASNSFTVWEDRIITFLLLSTLAPSVLTGFAAPTARLRYRILGFSVLFAVCVRLIAISTVCREEQQPHCHVTFFASATITASPTPVLVLAIPTALALPYFIRRILRISQSDKGLAAIFLPWILPAILLQGAAAWLLEWAESSDIVPEYVSLVRIARTLLGWGAIGGALAIGASLWRVIPLCLHVSASQPTSPTEKTEVTVLGFSNAFGSPYLMFWCIALGVFYAVNQLTAQIVLGLTTVAIVAYLEVLDSVHDVNNLNIAFASSTPSSILDMESPRGGNSAVVFSEITPLALLALHTFYATGHQSTISSIQWKAAFVLTSTLKYPISPVLVVLNEFSAQFLLALGTPLVALWNLAPLPHPTAIVQARRESVRAALGMMLYHGTLLLGSAVASAWLRRHLMVWKIFAPRFMNAAATLAVVDLALLLGIGVGVSRISERVGKLFGAKGAKTQKVQ